jgi:hypothetical protein
LLNGAKGVRMQLECGNRCNADSNPVIADSR